MQTMEISVSAIVINPTVEKRVMTTVMRTVIKIISLPQYHIIDFVNESAFRKASFQDFLNFFAIPYNTLLISKHLSCNNI